MAGPLSARLPWLDGNVTMVSMDDSEKGTPPAKSPAAPTRTARGKKAASAARPAARVAAKPPATSSSEPSGPPLGAWRRNGTGGLYSRRIQQANEHWPVVTRGLAAMFRHPGLVLAALGKDQPVQRDGRVLNRGVHAMIELGSRFAGAEGGDTEDVVVARAQLRRTARLAMPVRTDVHVSGRIIEGPSGAPPIPVRVYRRFGSGLGRGPDCGQGQPAIVYFHGGSWISGDLDSHDATCRMLAVASRCLVVSVAYRLAPEDPFPAAVEDALAAYAWVQRNLAELGVEPGRVAVMGDSAGANLAAVVALETREGGPGGTDTPPPVAQGLIYPVVDARLTTDSVKTFADGFFLTWAGMERARRLYLPDESDWTSPRASPLLADTHRGVAPALVVTAGFDPLRDDGANYAHTLRSSGVDVEYRCYDDQIHGFMGMGILGDSLALATEVCDAMGRLVRRSPTTTGAA